MILYIVRHGETDKNREKCMQGHIDTNLNANGIRQAELVRDALENRGIRFDRVYASPLRRAMQTARIIAGEAAEILADDRLLEMDYGPYEGASLENPPPELREFFQDFAHNPVPDGMESLDQVVARAGSFLREIQEQDAAAQASPAQDGPDGQRHVLIATHAIAMKGLLEYLTPGANGGCWSLYIGNCTVYRVLCEDGVYGAPEPILSYGGEPGM